MALFLGPSEWAGARRELLDFMVQGKINRGRHTDHPTGRHSIWTNQNCFNVVHKYFKQNYLNCQIINWQCKWNDLQIPCTRQRCAPAVPACDHHAALHASTPKFLYNHYNHKHDNHTRHTINTVVPMCKCIMRMREKEGKANTNSKFSTGGTGLKKRLGISAIDSVFKAVILNKILYALPIYFWYLTEGQRHILQRVMDRTNSRGFTPFLLWSRYTSRECSLWSPYVIGQTIIFSFCFFFLSSSSFFPRLISAVGDWMFTILWHMVWP